MKDRAGAYCFRFLPNSENSNLTDPRFTKGNLKITTIVEGRPANAWHADTFNSTESHNQAMKSYSATELCPFKDFNVNLTYGGAFQNMFVSAVGLATALVALTF